MGVQFTFFLNFGGSGGLGLHKSLTKLLDKFLLELKLLANSLSKIASILLEMNFFSGQRSYLQFEENLEEGKGKIEMKTGCVGWRGNV